MLTLIRVNVLAGQLKTKLPLGSYIIDGNSIIVTEQIYSDNYSELSIYPMSTFFRGVA